MQVTSAFLSDFWMLFSVKSAATCIWKDGESERFEWCTQEHVQCREEGQTTGHDQAFLKSDHQVPFGHAEAWFVSK